MAVLEMKNPRENMKNDKKGEKAAVRLNAEYIKYARNLAGNDKEERDRALQSLGKWFKKVQKSKVSLSEEELLVLWKGLFYSMWMSDKLLIQEECAENIAHLMHKLNDNQLMFFKCGLKTLCNEWFGIDQLRLDKFLMFARRLVRQALIVVRNNEWKFEYVKQFQDIMTETVLNPKPSGFLGLTMHISDIYWEEISKVSQGKMTHKTLNELLLPFLHFIVALDNACDIQNFSENIFRYLIKQTDLHIEYEEKFDAWRNMGYPGGDINKLQKEVIDDEDDDATDKDVSLGEQVLDPRAGSVHVTLPQLQFNAGQIASLLDKYKFGKGSNKKSRAVINNLIEDFKKVAKKVYPYGIKKVNLEDGKIDIKKATKDLMNMFDSKDKKKRKRKRKNNNEAVAVEEEEVQSKKGKFENKNQANKNVKKGKDVVPVIPNGAVNGLKVDKKPKKEKNKRKIDNVEDIQLNHTKKRNLNTSTIEDVVNNFEMEFTRNSGTWYVFSADDTAETSNITENGIQSSPKKCESPKSPKNKVDSNKSPKDKAEEGPKSPKVKEEESIKSPKGKVEESIKSPKGKVEESPKSAKCKAEGSPKSKAPESPKSPKQNKDNVIQIGTPKSEIVNDFQPNEESTPKKLFTQTAWDVPLLEGETEIFVPSNKYKKKMDKLGLKANVTVNGLLEKSVQKIKGKNSRHSMDPNIVRNPFARVGQSSVTGSAKKVKIDLRLNKSQEIHEHMAQLRSSPAIPFDANRKPSKPLLKPNAVASPINPFYKKKMLNIW
ncbi:PREDICTED: ribosomal RNA processing protein 1 homolog [Nicrophorus vespilloides]|uniref:Ribosomal RNA processing protein 1 homolog n=1 Tax=Nicrophorus vespilloides TaxID=110193 RepID=A0ABM1MS54_NICVS|nr:PREDICTED: ribosomal RNA processing protein 1 homolog [Nicrophorus vespilloides]